MTEDPRAVLKGLYDAFHDVPKPEPLADVALAHWPEEAAYFNAIDWRTASYADVVNGSEGLIVASLEARVWLIPRLFEIIVLRRTGEGCEAGAEDNLSEFLRGPIFETEMDRALTPDQKRTLIAAWAYLDAGPFAPSGSTYAQNLARRWGM